MQHSMDSPSNQNQEALEPGMLLALVEAEHTQQEHEHEEQLQQLQEVAQQPSQNENEPFQLPEEDYDVFRNVGQGLTGHYREIMMQYWQELVNEVEAINEPGANHDEDFRSHSLPFARIRKVMKTDEDVRMISAEAPVIFAKACEIFITEVTMRAWCASEAHKRRTLQRGDIAEALKQSDMFDFLIDVVPRQ
ncbi:transcriptional activator Hap5p [Monosporozyma unispora]|nr:CCAAT- binding transcription factor component [Kazachstania unispora]